MASARPIVLTLPKVMMQALIDRAARQGLSPGVVARDLLGYSLDQGTPMDPQGPGDSQAQR